MLRAAFGRVGPDAGDLGLDLALQVASEGADPHRTLVLLSPDAGGREIAERLAGSGARLGQHQMRIAFGLARPERGGGGAGVVGLAGPLLGMRAQNAGEAGAGFGFGDGMRGRRRRDGGFLELRQAAPDFQPVDRGGGVRAGPAPP